MLRPLLQSEAAECGLACLAMLSSAHGLRIDLAELRQRCLISLKGAARETDTPREVIRLRVSFAAA